MDHLFLLLYFKGEKDMKLKKSLSKFGKALSKNKARILTGMGITLGAATVVIAVKETPAALMDEEDLKLYAEQNGIELTKWDYIRLKAKHYWPAALTGLTAAGCIICSDYIDVKTIKTMAEGWLSAQEALKSFKAATKEQLGEKKTKQIEDKVAEEQLKKNPYHNSEVNPNDMGFLCYDANSGRYFKSTWEILNAAVNTVNSKINTEMFASLNDFYWEIGLKKTESGENNGWSEKISLYPTCHVGGEGVDDPDCVVINFSQDPSLDFMNINNH